MAKKAKKIVKKATKKAAAKKIVKKAIKKAASKVTKKIVKKKVVKVEPAKPARTGKKPPPKKRRSMVSPKAPAAPMMSRSGCVDECVRRWSGTSDFDDDTILGNIIDATPPRRTNFKNCITDCAGLAPGWHIDYGWTVGQLKAVVEGL